MKKNLVLTFLFLLPFISIEASEPKSYEMPRTQVLPIKDSNADRQYELYIKLPEGYLENTDVDYSVIYATDAIWHMDMLSGSTEYLMPNVILVGISWQKDLGTEKAHDSRFGDYTIRKYEDPETQAKYRGGQASNHLSFIRDDVIKYVEDNYRADPDERTYFGYSLGALFGAYVLLAQPDTFKHYILGSPSDNVKYIDQLKVKTAPEHQDLDVNVFVTIGELEESKIAIIEGSVSVLKRKSRASLTLTGPEIIEDSDHGTAFPETVIRGIKWLSQLKSE